MKLVKPTLGALSNETRDEGTERALLAAAASGNRDAIVALRMTQPTDFYSGASRDIRRHILELDDAGRPVDVTTLAASLHATDELGRIGGTSAIARLVDATPVCPAPREYARILSEQGERRRLVEWALLLAHEGKATGTSAADFVAAARAQCAKVAESVSAASDWPTTSELVARLGDVRPRLSTGLDALDEATRGGLRLGSVTVLGGAPGACKSTLANGLAVRWARAGVHVAIVTADEPIEDTLTRIGQQLGFAREDLESGNHQARAALANVLATLPLHVVDPEDRGAKLEDVSARLRRRANGEPSALVVDSVQTCPALGTEDADSYRERIDLLMKAAKRAAKRDGHAVVCTSELARGAYASKKATDRTVDLAAFKESGGIEYAAHVLLVLRVVEEGLVAVTNPKNRLGRRFDVMGLRMDFDRATLAVCDLPSADDDGESEDELDERILDTIARETSHKSVAGLAKSTHARKEKVAAAMERLAKSGAVRKVDGCFRRCVEVPS